jgi:hypothetical protein
MKFGEISMKSIKTTTHPILDANKKKELFLSFFPDSFHSKTFVFGRDTKREGEDSEVVGLLRRERERERRSGWK